MRRTNTLGATPGKREPLSISSATLRGWSIYQRRSMLCSLASICSSVGTARYEHAASLQWHRQCDARRRFLSPDPVSPELGIVATKLSATVKCGSVCSLYIGSRWVSRSTRHTDTHEMRVINTSPWASTNGNGCSSSHANSTTGSIKSYTTTRTAQRVLGVRIALFT